MTKFELKTPNLLYPSVIDGGCREGVLNEREFNDCLSVTSLFQIDWCIQFPSRL
jgi:hypothetical protein